MYTGMSFRPVLLFLIAYRCHCPPVSLLTCITHVDHYYNVVLRQNELQRGWSVALRLPRRQRRSTLCRHRALHGHV